MSRRTLVLGVIAFLILLVPVGIYIAPELVAFIYGIIFFLAPLWLPVILFWIAWPLWLVLIRSTYMAGIPYITLELEPGTETPSTAKAMELVFYSLYSRTNISRMEAFLFGRVREPFSLELYAHNGRVRFFVHLPQHKKTAFESRIRAEYHDISVNEVRDYSRELHFDPFSMKLIAKEYTLSKPDPYPLKTYVSYEEEKDAHDMFAELIERIAKTKEGEHILLSFIIRSHQRDRYSLFENPRDTLHEDAQKEIAKLVGHKGTFENLSPATKRVVSLIERALTKPSFDCGIRALYIASNESFDETYNEKLNTLFEPFNDEELNGFVAVHPHAKKGIFIAEIFSAVSELASGHLLDLYRRRAFFAPPYYGNAFVLNTEELATVFHIPYARRGSALARARGVVLQPPDNLPV